jgi:hypothetical protein
VPAAEAPAAEDVEPAAAGAPVVLELVGVELLPELLPQAASARTHRAMKATIVNRLDIVSKSSWIGPGRR